MLQKNLLHPVINCFSQRHVQKKGNNQSRVSMCFPLKLPPLRFQEVALFFDPPYEGSVLVLDNSTAKGLPSSGKEQIKYP